MSGQAQRARVQALGLLEAIAQSSTDAIFAKERQGRYIFYNRAACDEVGMARDAVLGRTDEALFGAEVAAQLGQHDQAVLASATSRVFDEVLPGPGGERFNRCAKGPLFDADGTLIGLFGVSRDTTEARRTERALRDSEAHYRTVVAVLNQGILVCDPQGVVLSCNPAAERIVGLPQLDWQGRPVLPPGWTLLRPDGSPMPFEECPPGLVLAGAPAQHAVLLCTRDPQSQQVWLEASAQPVHSPDSGALLAVVTLFSDVTQRKQQDDELAAERTAELSRANAALAAAARFNRTVTDNLHASVSYWDADMRCRFVNQEFLQRFGLAEERVLGHRVNEVFEGDFLRGAMARLKAAL